MALSLWFLLAMAAADEGSLRGTEVPHKVLPGEQCTFMLPPEVPYYWEPTCKMGMLGCWADGVHAECRFCGEAPYTGLTCPSDAVVPTTKACNFDNPPITPVYWDAQCEMGKKGCFADGKHLGCRFCGTGDYSDIPCPYKVCSYTNEPVTPYYWDENCQMGMLGCNADGIHTQCRFCEKMPFQSITCPESARPPYGECWFPVKPKQSFFWDPSCAWGILGCWADGVHAECRFCGGNSSYAPIHCP